MVASTALISALFIPHTPVPRAAIKLQYDQQQYVQALVESPDDKEYAGNLPFGAGDVIAIIQQGAPGDWWQGSCNGATGLFPSSFCSTPFGVAELAHAGAPNNGGGDGAMVWSGMWRLTPVSGVGSEYAMRSGEEQVLGCNDMIQPLPYVSQAQCVIQVSADGTASIVSVGDRATQMRAREGAPWYGLKMGTAHILVDGEQIALDAYDKTAVFTCQEDRAYSDVDVGGFPQQQQQQGGYGYR